MDVNSPSANNDRCFECVDVGDTTDWISKLPDDILGNILSYLSTTEAMATCILSKRWEHLWTLTSNLDICDVGLKAYESPDRTIKLNSLLEDMDKVIFNHGGSSITKCEMTFYSRSVASRYYSWICAVITCNVKELFLQFYGFHSVFQLPSRLFSCNALVVMKISGNFDLDVPTSACFPCLRILQIERAVFVDDASAEKLFSSCPILEDLSIQRFRDFLQTMTISAPSLKRLWLYSGNTDIQTNINTPRLEYLYVHHHQDYAPGTYSVNFTSSLVHAELEGFSGCLLNRISHHVENVTLRGNDMSLHKVIRESALPLFKNLKIMKLLVGWLIYWESVNWKFLPKLLDSSPNLQVLTFPQGLVCFSLNMEDFSHFNWQRPVYVPECLSLHMKTIEIFEFVGFQEELDIVEYLLESAEVLEKVIIHRFDVSKHLVMEEKVKGDEAFAELLRHKRISSTIEVMSFRRRSSSAEVFFYN